MKKLYSPLMLLVALFVSLNVFSMPALNSHTSASATIYLDFDGYTVNCAYWKNGAAFTCDPSGMADDQITEIFNRVAEDFRPFDINVTTDESKFIAAPLSSRMRVVITPTSSWYPGVAGAAYTGSFSWGDDTPCFVFCDKLGPKNPKMVAECCSHESGHAFGLYHQSEYDSTGNMTKLYNEGKGVGQTSWAPIMGTSYYKNMTGWSNGPTPYGSNNTQDDLAVISSENGFGYRVDDYSDDINDNPTALDLSGANVEGIISTSTDKDAFTFTLAQNSAVHIHITPFSVDSNFAAANLDIKMLLYNAAHELVKTYDPQLAPDALADTALQQGTWYLVIDGGGNDNMDDYGSLGAYTISSSVTVLAPALSAVLTGMDDLSKHILNWNIVSNENIKLITVESSTDGTRFDIINTISGVSKDFIYTPFQKTDLYYRIKATSVLNHTTYSNTIMLKSVAKTGQAFTVSTFIHSEITVDASKDYEYLVSDANGGMIAKGKGYTGFNRLNMSRFPGGMYVIQLISNNQRQTERIIKQ